MEALKILAGYGKPVAGPLLLDLRSVEHSPPGPVAQRGLPGLLPTCSAEPGSLLRKGQLSGLRSVR